MAEYSGYTVTMQVLEGNLFPDTDGIDMHASAESYVDQLQARLEAALPGAEVDIEFQRDTEGASRETTVYGLGTDLDEAEDIRLTADAVASTLWADFAEWLVDA